MKQITVLGGSGFLGSTLANLLSKNDKINQCNIAQNVLENVLEIVIVKNDFL